jgi:hypothetical protein
MTTGAVEEPRHHELALFVLQAFAISWAMHIPLALATLRSGDPSFPVAATTTPQRHTGLTTPSTGRFPEVSGCVPCRARVTQAVMRCASRDQCNGASWP